MDTDPTRNTVVFATADGRYQVVEVPARADDGVRQAWRTAVAEHGLTEPDVSEVYAEWEPSAADGAFLELTFPGVAVSYTFARPAGDGWDAAFDAARRTIAARQPAAATPDDLLPILRSTALPGTAGTLELLPYRMVVPGRLAVTLARVGLTDRGTIGMHHVTNAQLGTGDFDAALDTARDALRRGLQVTRRSGDTGDVIQLHRDGYLAGSAVVLPDFHEFVSGLLSAYDLVAAIPCPDDLFVAAAGTGAAEILARMVAESPQQSAEMLPTLLRMTGPDIELLAEAPTAR